eukprot:scaffold67433_cov61-Phaeocystis_antarctica.AAC.3
MPFQGGRGPASVSSESSAAAGWCGPAVATSESSATTTAAATAAAFGRDSCLHSVNAGSSSASVVMAVRR